MSASLFERARILAAGRTLARDLSGTADPYPLYEQLRGPGSLHHGPNAPFWISTDHAVVTEVLRDPRFGRRPAGYRDFLSRARLANKRHPFVESMLVSDPPDHTRLRGVAAPRLSTVAVRKLEAQALSTAEALLDRLPDSGVVDLVADFAEPYPIHLVCALLGLPTTDTDRLRSWGEVLSASIDGVGLVELEYDPAITVVVNQLVEYFEAQFDARRDSPHDDLLGDLVQAHDTARAISTEELHATCRILLVAGFETTINLVGNGLLALVRHPDQLHLLRRQPRLMENAVEEILRFDPSIQYTGRLALQDVEVAGQSIRSGEPVACMLAAANRDPAVFQLPASFDITRRNASRHLAFASGPHYCLGAALARLEGAAAFGAVLSRYSEIRLAGAPTRRPSRLLRRIASLPVEVSS